MGYDFEFEKAVDLTGVSFPCGFGEFEQERGTFPWQILKSYLRFKGAKPNAGPDDLFFDLKDKGHMYVTGSEDYVAIDMHADWEALLDLFLWLREREPNVVLADSNEGVYHDPESFRNLIKLNLNDE